MKDGAKVLPKIAYASKYDMCMLPHFIHNVSTIEPTFTHANRTRAMMYSRTIHKQRPYRRSKTTVVIADRAVIARTAEQDKTHTATSDTQYRPLFGRFRRPATSTNQPSNRTTTHTLVAHARVLCWCETMDETRQTSSIPHIDGTAAYDHLFLFLRLCVCDRRVRA